MLTAEKIRAEIKSEYEERLLNLAALLVLMPTHVVFRIYTTIVLWGWFVTPTFHIDAPSWAMCCGLMTAWGVFQSDGRRVLKDESIYESFAVQLLTGIFRTGFGLLTGWLLTFCL